MAPVNRQQARRLITRVIQDLNDAEQAMLQLWEAKAWTVLGYDDWNAMCAAEFKALRELNRNSRKALVAGMTQRGMSTRAQAAVVGVSDQTVRADQVRENHAPANVIGLDGKTYTRPTGVERSTVARDLPVPRGTEPSTDDIVRQLTSIDRRIGKQLEPVAELLNLRRDLYRRIHPDDEQRVATEAAATANFSILDAWSVLVVAINIVLTAVNSGNRGDGLTPDTAIGLIKALRHVADVVASGRKA